MNIISIIKKLLDVLRGRDIAYYVDEDGYVVVRGEHKVVEDSRGCVVITSSRNLVVFRDCYVVSEKRTLLSNRIVETRIASNSNRIDIFTIDDNDLYDILNNDIMKRYEDLLRI